jgi:hypothetical protein
MVQILPIWVVPVRRLISVLLGGAVVPYFGGLREIELVGVPSHLGHFLTHSIDAITFVSEAEGVDRLRGVQRGFLPTRSAGAQAQIAVLPTDD